MTDHLQASVKEVVILAALFFLRFIRASLLPGRGSFADLKFVLTFLIDLGNDVDSEAEGVLVRVLFKHTLSKPQHIEIYDMTVL